MDDKKKVVIKSSNGSATEVEVITYLIREDNTGAYLVYSKGEKTGEENDEVIYISRIVTKDGVDELVGIADDNEWTEVQSLLKKIANA